METQDFWASADPETSLVGTGTGFHDFLKQVGTKFCKKKKLKNKIVKNIWPRYPERAHKFVYMVPSFKQMSKQHTSVIHISSWRKFISFIGLSLII